MTTTLLSHRAAHLDELPPRAGDLDLETILAAWHEATNRLQGTHEALRSEVHRLSDELEIKNRELARQNRLADLGQMASHVAHEVRNNLVPVTLYLSLLRRRLEGQAAALDCLDKIDAGFAAVEATVQDLLHFTADRDPQWGRCEVGELVQDVCGSLAPQLAAQRIRTALDVPRGTALRADRDMLRRAVLNLVLNALDVMPTGGDLAITAWPGRQGLELEVADSGPGISTSVRNRIFEPFFTTKRGGTGLGLAIVYRIAEVHGGDVRVTNCPEGGAAFTLRLPHSVLETAS
jgi:signal transduction histidine kinase